MASAATISAGQNEYFKGNELVFNGLLEAGTTDTVVVKNGNMLVFEKTVRGKPDGTFSFTYSSDFLDPSGEWTVSLTENEAVTKVNVESVPDSSALVIKFNSPIPTEYRRTEDLDISVMVTYLGEALTQTNVVVWGANGEKLILEERGNGAYGLSYAIPHNAYLGDWTFVAVAQKVVDNKSLGGENRIHPGIVNAGIEIEVLEPSISKAEIGQELTIVTALKYSSGKIPKQATLLAKVKELEIKFSQQDDGTLIAKYTPAEHESGELVFELFASDNQGNTGEKKLTIVVGGWIEWFVKTNWPYFAIVIIVILLILFKMRSKLVRSTNLAKLKQGKAAEFAKIQKLQNDYFKVQAIDRKTFDERSTIAERNMASLDKKINELEAKKK